jgi:hypothetical protein
MSNYPKSGNFVALVHKLCPICAATSEEEILLHKQFRDVSEYHNKAVGFGAICKECQGAIDQGAIMIIVVDEAKSGDLQNPAEWYRTGNVFGIRQGKIEEMLEGSPLLEGVLKKRALIMDYKIALAIDLPVKYEP